jgi:hypothetical protein
MRIFKTLFVALAFCSVSSFAQDVPVEELPTATLDENFYLTLDPTAPVSEYYFVDISHLDFASEDELTKKCGYYLTANLITPEVHYGDNYLVVRIHTEYLSGEVAYEQVQTYLNQLTKP